jgi:hypothetical protein
MLRSQVETKVRKEIEQEMRMKPFPTTPNKVDLPVARYNIQDLDYKLEPSLYNQHKQKIGTSLQRLRELKKSAKPEKGSRVTQNEEHNEQRTDHDTTSKSSGYLKRVHLILTFAKVTICYLSYTEMTSLAKLP